MERHGNWTTDKKWLVRHLVTGTVTTYHLLRQERVNSISDDNGKISVLIGTLLYVFGLCVRHSELTDRRAGLVVKASASGVEDQGFESRLRRDFSGSSHTCDLIDTPVTTLPGAWRYKVSAGTGRPGVSIP